MRAECQYLIAVAIGTGIMFGQQKPNDGPALVTVCQVLADVSRYTDRAVSVVGRMERSVSLIDHYEFLSQDGCEHPTNGLSGPWSQKIEIWTGWEEGMPKPPSDRPRLTRGAIAATLSLVRKGTKLGSHEEPNADIHTAAHGHSNVVQNDWAVVYGRIVKAHTGDDVQLMILAEPGAVRRIRVNGTFLPTDQ
jgi:hypothetical protein